MLSVDESGTSLSMKTAVPREYRLSLLPYATNVDRKTPRKYRIELSGFSTIDHDLHRLRRAALAKFFSRAQIWRLETEIQALVQRLCDKLLRESGRGEPVEVTTAYSCFTSDAISDYCFGQSFGFLAQESWYPNYRAAACALLKIVYVFRYFPILRHLSFAASWWVESIHFSLSPCFVLFCILY